MEWEMATCIITCTILNVQNFLLIRWVWLSRGVAMSRDYVSLGWSGIAVNEFIRTILYTINGT